MAWIDIKDGSSNPAVILSPFSLILANGANTGYVWECQNEDGLGAWAPGGGGGGDVSSVSAEDGTVLITPTTGNVVVSATGAFGSKNISSTGTLSVTGDSTLGNVQIGSGDGKVLVEASTGDTFIAGTLGVVQASTLDNGAISTDGSGNLTAGGIISDFVDTSEIATGSIGTTAFKLTTSPATGYVLTSDSSGNGTWQAGGGGGAVSSVTAGDGTVTVSPTTGAVAVSATGAFGAKNISTSGALQCGTLDSDEGGITSDGFGSLAVSGRTTCSLFTLTGGARLGYVLTSDASGNSAWHPDGSSILTANTSSTASGIWGASMSYPVTIYAVKQGKLVTLSCSGVVQDEAMGGTGTVQIGPFTLDPIFAPTANTGGTYETGVVISDNGILSLGIASAQISTVTNIITVNTGSYGPFSMLSAGGPGGFQNMTLSWMTDA